MLNLLDGKEIFDKADALRKEKGWTIYELAKNAGVSPTTIYNWRDRLSSPSLALLDAVCSAFGISVISFLSDGDEPIPLTEEEKTLVHLWEALSAEQRKSVISLMKSMQV